MFFSFSLFRVDEKIVSSSPAYQGVTVLLIACSYLDQEFIRVGYYVYNEYLPFEGYKEDIHGPPPIETETIANHHILRRIVADKPRITRFPIHWSGMTMESNHLSSMNEGKDSCIVPSIHQSVNTNTIQIPIDIIHTETDMSIFMEENIMSSPTRSTMDNIMIQTYKAVTPEFA